MSTSLLPNCSLSAIILTFMKKDIHPKYYPAVKAKCACGAEFIVGSTSPELKVEICSQCHPFYTGEKKIIDTAGRVEKFKTRQSKTTAKPRSKTEKKAKKTAANKKKKTVK